MKSKVSQTSNKHNNSSNKLMAWTVLFQFLGHSIRSSICYCSLPSVSPRSFLANFSRYDCLLSVTGRQKPLIRILAKKKRKKHRNFPWFPSFFYFWLSCLIWLLRKSPSRVPERQNYTSFIYFKRRKQSNIRLLKKCRFFFPIIIVCVCIGFNCCKNTSCTTSLFPLRHTLQNREVWFQAWLSIALRRRYGISKMLLPNRNSSWSLFLSTRRQRS